MSQVTGATGGILPTAAPPAGAGKKTTARSGKVRQRKITPYLFLLAPLVLLITFSYVPAANLIWYSFTSWDGIDQTKKLVGIQNYIDIFTKPEIFRVFFARVAEDKLMRRFVEIEIRDGEPNTIDGRNDRGYAGNERIEEHLFANAVERRGRNAQDTLHDTREKEPFLKA